jgi:hypothetical protein
MAEQNMCNEITIPILPAYFSNRENILAKAGELIASTFTYSTGVAGLRIANSVGELEILPFQGQQIWRATFYGRPLTMRSMFNEPNPTTDYLSTYGGFLIHCGAIGMGNPSSEDTHPVHGELPNAHYRQAELLIGSDEHGPYISLTGKYQYSVAFSHNYIAQPTLTLRENDGRIHVTMVIKNLKYSPMEFMYLAHINFLPVDNGQIVDTAPIGIAHVRITHVMQGLYESSPTYRNMIEDFEHDPEKHRTLLSGGLIDPEIVLAVNALPDKRGWATSMQIHPDGTADFVRHRPEEFKHCLRWICRSGDQEALGLLLPSTAEPDGYLAERAKGNLQIINPHEEACFSFECGMLDVSASQEMSEAISDLRLTYLAND